MILLDTNAIIAASNKRPLVVAERLDAELAAGRNLVTSSIVAFELRYGIAKSHRPQANALVFEHFFASITVLNFDAEDAVIAGELRAALAAGGVPIGPYDVLIAGQALRHKATLVTANVREFSRVPGLKVEDWTAE